MRAAATTRLLSGLPVLLAAWALLAPRALAAAQDSYFPLAAGNEWVYRQAGTGAGGDLQVKVDLTRVTSGGHRWFRIRAYNGTEHWVRETAGERVYEYPRRLWYRLGAPVGTSWTLEIAADPARMTIPCSSGAALEVASRSEQVSVEAGTFTTVHIRFRNTCRDAGITDEWFAKGVGLVKRTEQTFGGPRTLELASARVGGMTIGGTPRAPTTTASAPQIPTLWRMADTSAIPASWYSGLGPIAPDIVRLDDGRYRMYFNAPMQGVASAVSTDGLTWRLEPGLRLRSRRIQGEWLFDVGHPAVLRLRDGRWRIYYQGNRGINLDGCRTYSAVSTDGLTFQEEGVRVDNAGSPFTFAGHARVWRGRDGLVRMLMSANTPDDTGPSDTALLESSDDGLTFRLLDAHLFREGHDPAVLVDYGGTPGVLAIWAYLVDGFQGSWSADGVRFTRPVRIDVIDSTGARIDYAPSGDVCLLTLPDGRLAMYGNWSDGIRLYLPVN